MCVADSLDDARLSFDEFTESIQEYLTNLEVTKAYEKFRPLYQKLMDEEEEDDEHNRSSISRSESHYSLSSSAMCRSDGTVSRSGSTISFANSFDDDDDDLYEVDNQRERRVRFLD
ncbi:MAG: hypothetical protein BWZ03_00314 [bacterium ADurb.BinA186]|nr:MAG: hypothetical protein BWZ03_00314 [bacterium ADurb.BinA186]